jgi:hypothetical protein
MDRIVVRKTLVCTSAQSCTTSFEEEEEEEEAAKSCRKVSNASLRTCSFLGADMLSELLTCITAEEAGISLSSLAITNTQQHKTPNSPTHPEKQKTHTTSPLSHAQRERSRADCAGESAGALLTCLTTC